MGKYTIELNEIINDDYTDIFDFEYSFFNPNVKSIWEQKFLNYYYYYEINTMDINKWKYMLKTRLNMIYFKYFQLYQTELKSQNIEFLLNKDLNETTTRDLNENKENNSHLTNTTNVNNNSNVNMETNTENKQSNLDNGLASVSDTSLTSLELDNNRVNQDVNNTTTSNNTNENVEKNKNNTTEKLTLSSKGNIGTTSSAELLQKWRDVLIDLQKMMIDECRDLFLYVY